MIGKAAVAGLHFWSVSPTVTKRGLYTKGEDKANFGRLGRKCESGGRRKPGADSLSTKLFRNFFRVADDSSDLRDSGNIQAMTLAGKFLSTLPKETYIAGITVIAIGLHLVLRYGTHVPLRVTQAPLIVALLVGGTPLVINLGKQLPPIGGAIAQEFIDLFAVLNAVRMALPTDDDLQDF
jgi:hypothetical protein